MCIDIENDKEPYGLSHCTAMHCTKSIRLYTEKKGRATMAPPL